VLGLFFPHHEHPERPLRSTIVDAELVIDVDPRTKQVCRVRRNVPGRLNENAPHFSVGNPPSALFRLPRRGQSERHVQNARQKIWGNVDFWRIASSIFFDVHCLQRLKEVFFKPYAKMLRDHPHVAKDQPFEWV